MKDAGICAKVAYAIQNQRSSLEPKLQQNVYRKLCMAYRLVTNPET